MFSALRFIWNATRGHRLAPWRSEYIRWRVETYSGKPAETLTARDIFGSPDDLKFRSSMTLFGAVSDNPMFGEAITKYYAGDKDQATLDILARIVH